MEEKAFRAIGATTYLCPTPTVVVGCAADDGWKRGEGRPNLVTVAWAGICCTKPSMISIALRPERFSYGLIKQSGEFTVNLIGQSLLNAMDFCGVKSGRDIDKFVTLGLHPAEAEPLMIAPALAEAPAYLCCKVRQVLPLGTHDLFIAEIVQVHVNERFFREDGSIDESAMELVAYVHGKYRALGAELGFFGYSVASEDALKRRAQTVMQQASQTDKRNGPRSAGSSEKGELEIIGRAATAASLHKKPRRSLARTGKRSGEKVSANASAADNRAPIAEMKNDAKTGAIRAPKKKQTRDPGTTHHAKRGAKP